MSVLTKGRKAALMMALAGSALIGAFAQAEVPRPVADNIISVLKSGRPDLNFGEVKESPIPGMYRVQVQNGPLFFVSADGKYFLTGDMYQVKSNEYVNLQEVERTAKRKEIMAIVDPKDEIIFKPKGETKAVIQVFTDVDCGYCQKLHREIAELNGYGIEVRYLAYPRAGVQSEAFNKLATAWCSDNPQETLTRFKNRERVKIDVCEKNPVAMQFQLGNMVGVRGTPALVLADGTMVPGYRPAKDLAEMLGLL